METFICNDCKRRLPVDILADSCLETVSTGDKSLAIMLLSDDQRVCQECAEDIFLDETFEIDFEEPESVYARTYEEEWLFSGLGEPDLAQWQAYVMNY